MVSYTLLLFYLLLSLIIISLNCILYNKILIPNNIFTIMWCFCGVFSMYNRVNLVRPRLEIHIFILICIISFNFFYYLTSNKFFKTKKIIKEKNFDKEYIINNNIIYLLFIISLILIIPNMINSIQIIIKYGFNLNLIRQEVYMDISYSGAHIFAFITKNIPQSIFNAISLIAAINIVRGEKSIVKIGIISIAINILTFGGRYSLLNFLIYYIAAYLILGNTLIKIKKKYIIISLICLIFATFSRGLGTLSFFDMIITYFVGSFSYLEVILQNPTSFGLDEPLLWGYLTLGFIFEPIVMGLKLLFQFDIDVPSYYFNIYTQNFVNISTDGIQMYNNNATIIYTFLRDFGVLGMIVGTGFIASLMNILSNKYYQKKDIRYLFFLVYLYSVIINSTMMYTMTSVTTSLLILIIIFSVKRVKNKKSFITS